jgi:hypothetical protein
VAALFLAIPAFSQALWTVDFVHGEVTQTNKGVELRLSAGIQLPGDSTIRVGKGALVELSSGGRKISIVREGSYTINAIASSVATSSPKGFMEALGEKLRSMLKGSAGEQMVAGVRASEAAKPAGFSTGGEEARKNGEAAMLAGNYSAAVSEFEYALEEALPGEEGEIRTSLASALVMLDRPMEALAVLREGERDVNPQGHILEATLLLGAGAADEALKVLSLAPKPLYGTDAQKAAVNAELAELEGLALELSGRLKEAAEAYRRSMAAAPDSDAARRAKTRLAAIGG